MDDDRGIDGLLLRADIGEKVGLAPRGRVEAENTKGAKNWRPFSFGSRLSTGLELFYAGNRKFGLRYTSLILSPYWLKMFEILSFQ